MRVPLVMRQRATKRAGRNPSVAKRLKRANVATDDSATFEVLAREWHRLNKSRWTPVHADDTIHSLERDVFPEIGALPVREIAGASTPREGSTTSHNRFG
jgi:hypothetical protein